MSPEKVTCPFCGEEIDADALQCPRCGNSWGDAEEREAIRVMLNVPGLGEKRIKKLYEAGFRKIRDIEEADLDEILKKAGIPFRVAKEVKERVEEKKGIYICPECGAFVSADAEVCPICGAPLEEVKEISESAPTALKDDLFVEDSGELYLCKICGAFVSENMSACPICGAPMPENRADIHEKKVEDKYLEDEEKNIETIKKFFRVESISETAIPTDDVLETTTEIDICENCGAFVRPEAEVCPICGASLVREIPAEEEEKEEYEALLALEDLKEELIGAEIPEIEADEHQEITFVCPECGAEVPEDSERCPNCGALFVENKEDKEEEAVLLSLEDVIESKEMPEKTQVRPDSEEIKAEVDSLLISSEREKVGEFEELELSLGLEGGLDEIARIDVPERKEKRIKVPVLDTPKKTRKKEWQRLEDYTMAAATIAVVLLSVEYLLTYPFVTQPKIAYGTSALFIFVSLAIISSILLFLDRKEIFSKAVPNMFFIFPVIFVLYLPLHWYFGITFERPLLSDVIIAILSSVLLISLFFIFKDQLNNFFIFFLGLSTVAIHSIMFVWDVYLKIPYFDPVPVYAVPLFGGALLSLGVYMRIDSVVRAILSTRDVLLGHKYYISGEYDKAMKYYTRAIERKRGEEKGYDLAYYSKGTALLSAGNTIEALKYLNRAIKDNPDNEMAWNNRGIALANLGLEEAALKSYDRAIMINPNYEVAWNNKGNALARMGRYEEALRCYEKALEINPEYRDAWMNKGYVLIKLDRYREARECAEHILPSGKRRRKASRIPA